MTIREEAINFRNPRTRAYDRVIRIMLNGFCYMNGVSRKVGTFSSTFENDDMRSLSTFDEGPRDSYSKG